MINIRQFNRLHRNSIIENTSTGKTYLVKKQAEFHQFPGMMQKAISVTCREDAIKRPMLFRRSRLKRFIVISY